MKRLTLIAAVVLAIAGPVAGSDVVRSRPVRIDTGELAGAQRGGRLVFNLFEDLSLVATVTERKERSRDRFTLAGAISGVAGGSFILAVNRDAVAGYINAGELGTYRLRFRGDGLYTAQQTDPARGFVCDVDGEGAEDCGRPGEASRRCL